MYEKWKQWQYYLIIGVVSLVALLFLPMVGSEAGLSWNIPDTPVGIAVYILSKLIVAAISILVFHCFILQGKVNILSDKRYIEALNIMDKYAEGEDLKPRSPAEWKRNVYGKKGTAVFATSVLSSVGLTQAVLSFDWMTFLSYLFTILTSIIFGILQMNQTELYWTEEFLNYAKMKEKMKNDNCERSTAPEFGRAGTGESEENS